MKGKGEKEKVKMNYQKIERGFPVWQIVPKSLYPSPPFPLPSLPRKTEEKKKKIDLFYKILKRHRSN